MKNRVLLDNLSKLGFPLLEPSQDPDVQETLAEVVKSHEGRLWEGFPVLMANAAENYVFSADNIEKLLNKKEKNDFRHLIVMSLSLYAHYNLSFVWENKIKNNLTANYMHKLKKWEICLSNNTPITWGDEEIDPYRLKKQFAMYFQRNAAKSKSKNDEYEALSIEYAQSQVFSPRQKEIFKKKLDGMPLTKTEREYYSRTIKRKVVALANSELHSLAKKLLEQV